MASISYAKQAGQHVRGRLATEVGAGTENMPAVDSFYEGYESNVEKEIKGELKKSFSLYRENSNGTIDYKAYYIINEEAASNARIRAMQIALKESEFARQNAERITKFVQEGFEFQNE
jgi:Ca2+-binding EF-hand superfamily protein